MKSKVLLRLATTIFLLTAFLFPAYAATTKAPAKIGLVFSAQTATQPRQSGVYLAQIADGKIKIIPLLEKPGVCFCCQFISQEHYVISCDGNRLFVSDLQTCRSSSLPTSGGPGSQGVQEAAPGDIYTISPTGHLQVCHLATLKMEAVDFPLQEISDKPEYGQMYHLRLSPDRQKLTFFAAPKKMSDDSGWSLLVLDRAGKLTVLDRGLWRSWSPVVSWSPGPYLSWQGNSKIYYQNYTGTADQKGAYENKCADLKGRITLLNESLPHQGAEPSPTEARYVESHDRNKTALQDKISHQLIWQGEVGLLGNYLPSQDDKLLAFLVREKNDSKSFNLWLYDGDKKRSQKIFEGQDFSPLRWIKLDSKVE